MRQFRIALTGDFLDESGAVAYGDVGLARLADQPHIAWRFLHDLAPTKDDSTLLVQALLAGDRPRAYPERRRSGCASPVGQAKHVRAGCRRPRRHRPIGAGYDKIDLAACTENGVAVFNAPLALNHSTASSALLFMLALAKRLPEQERITRQGRWDLQAAVMGSEIRGRTLGIVGLGHTGRELARLVAPFSMRILGFSPHADPALARSLGVQLTSLEQVLRESDFLSLHCRLNESTRGMIGAAELSLMKPTACFINVGRGELVDQHALVTALRDRRITAAALDVYTVEPLPADDPLIALDNVILTPHWSASTTDVWQATGRAMVDGMLRASRGLVPENVVNPEVLDRPSFLDKLSRFSIAP